jgi:hypothetical protein
MSYRNTSKEVKVKMEEELTCGVLSLGEIQAAVAEMSRTGQLPAKVVAHLKECDLCEDLFQLEVKRVQKAKLSA